MNPACKLKAEELLDNAAKFELQGKDREVMEAFVGEFFEKGLAGQKPNIGQMVNEYLINGMISGLGTPIVNVTGGASQTFLKPFMQLIDSYVPKFGKYSDAQVKSARREARAMVSALFDGWAMDMQYFNQAMKTSLPFDYTVTPAKLKMTDKQFRELMIDLGAQPDADGNINPALAAKVLGENYDYMTKAIPGVAGSIVRVPSRVTIAIDEYFKARLRNQKMLGLLSRKASKDADDGLGTYEALYDSYKQKVFNSGKTDDLFSKLDRFDQMFGGDDMSTAIYDVRNYAKDGAFQAEVKGFAADIQKYKGSGRTPVEFFMTQAIPFLRTPWNIVKESSGYVPGIGLVVRPSKTVTEAIKKGDKVYFDTKTVNMSMEEMAGRQIVGTGIFLGMGALFASDRLTGSEPTDAAQREAWRASGKQPLSIKVGDKWVSYAKAEPLATVMGMAADYFEFEARRNDRDFPDDQLSKEAGKAALASLKSNILQKSFMQGFADMMNLWGADDTFAMTNYFDNVVKRFVPAISNTVARYKDDYEREAISTVEKLSQRIPYLRETLPYKYSPYAPDGVMEPQRTNTVGAVTGVAVSDDPTEFQKIMQGLRLELKPPSRKVGNTQLTAEQYSFYKQEINREASPLLKGYAPALAKMPARAAENVVESKIMTKVRQVARQRLLTKYPDLYEDAIKDKAWRLGME